MGRGVSYPHGSLVAYTTFDSTDDDYINDINWSDFLDCYKTTLQARYPSLDEVEAWLGNEDRIILENYHVKVGVSEYCGCVALWVLPDPYEPRFSGLANRTAEYIHAYIEKEFSTIIKVATGSNGVPLYERRRGAIANT